MWRPDLPVRLEFASSPERGSSNGVRKTRPRFHRAILGIVYRGFVYLDAMPSFYGKRFVLAFPKIKAHCTALEPHGVLPWILLSTNDSLAPSYLSWRPIKDANSIIILNGTLVFRRVRMWIFALYWVLSSIFISIELCLPWLLCMARKAPTAVPRNPSRLSNRSNPRFMVKEFRPHKVIG